MTYTTIHTWKTLSNGSPSFNIEAKPIEPNTLPSASLSSWDVSKEVQLLYTFLVLDEPWCYELSSLISGW